MNATILGRVCGGEDLSMPEMTEVMDQIMRGRWSDRDTALLLTGLRAKGETAEEIAGAAAALRRHMLAIRTRHENCIDTCGTGGDGSGTFNISTAAALVIAATGVPVAKHGNRKITSRTGSADVLAELGVNIDADPATVERCLDQVGIGFCFAPHVHQAMRNVAEVRRQLAFPTVFNYLGPLCNPASVPYQLLGVGNPSIHETIASALALLTIRRAAVVRGEDGLDEVGLAGPTEVIEIRGSSMNRYRWTPEQFGLSRADHRALRVDGPAESAELIQEILSGRTGPARDIVVLNAAAALWIADWNPSPRKCASAAAESIDGGAASRLLRDLAEVSHSC